MRSLISARFATRRPRPASPPGLHKNVGLIFNTSVADSEAVADYYCAKRGVPTENKIGFALGTNAVTCSTMSRDETYEKFWAPIADFCIEKGLDGVFTVAGVPQRMPLADRDTPENSTPVYIDDMLSYVKAIKADGRAPVAFDQQSGQYLAYTPDKVRYGGVNQVGDWTFDPLALQRVRALQQFPEFQTVVADNALGSAASYDHHIRKDLYQSRYRDLKWILTGRVGLYQANQSDTWDEDLLDKSMRIIDDAVSSEASLERARQLPIVVGISSLSNYPNEVFAHWVRFLEDNGFENVRYFYANGSTRPGANFFAPAEDAISFDDINDNLVNVPFWLAMGPGFLNDTWNPENEPTWRDLDNGPVFQPIRGALILSGQSSIDNWCMSIQQDGGVGGIARMAHQGPQNAVNGLVWLQHFLDGRAVCEAAWAGSGSAGWFLHAVGDPLYRPINLDL